MTIIQMKRALKLAPVILHYLDHERPITMALNAQYVYVM